MKKNYTLTPIKFAETNSVLVGSGTVKDIPCYRDETQVITRWKLRGLWERILFLFKGEVNIICLGDTQPPMSVRIDTPFEKEAI